LIDRATFDTALSGMSADVAGGGAIAQGPGAQAVGAQGVGIGRDHQGRINTGQEVAAAEGAQIVYAEQGATVVIGDAPVPMTAVDRRSTLGR
jgi:hypothetical protein